MVPRGIFSKTGTGSAGGYGEPISTPGRPTVPPRLRTSDLDLHDDRAFVDSQARIDLIVRHGHHVALASGDLRQQPVEVPGLVGDARRDDHVPTGGNHAALHDAQQQQRVDVASGQRDDQRWLEEFRVDQNRRQPRSAGGFDDQLLRFQTGDNRLGDLLVVDGQEFTGPFDDPERA